ncbi:hypothetical protein NliqN6_3241 [Naganishia liquefaciens]|uniref:CCAAT-binding factor domain-containing protein n=1 Tax=Naganishia liquefaciens TaxID=104408 RepID=A0A8H3TVC3_9TREE|nr:hypothetical protein NliqN6_3241 [Naganishia liquefaciens]
MARKSKDPRKPSQAFLRETGQATLNDNGAAAKTQAPAVPANSDEGDILRRAIRELGGDNSDYELIKDLSDDEEEATQPKSKAKKTQAGPLDDAKLKKELSSFMKGLDFSVAAPEAEEDEEELEASEDEDEQEERQETDEEEDLDAAEESEEDEDVDMSANEPVDEAKAKPARSASPEIEGFVKKSGLSAVQPSSDASIFNIPQEPLWYNIPLAELPDYEQTEPLPPFRLAGLQSRVNSLLSQFRTAVTTGTSAGKGKGASKNSSTFGKSTADAAFLRQVLQDGTHQDKLSALILLVRESPLHRMDELERLRIMAGGKQYDTSDASSSTYSGVKGGGGREERMAVVRALADWWVSGGGKESGKLRYLADQPQLGNPAVTDRHLLLWGFEDWLKKWFFSILQILEVYLADTLSYVKTQAMAVTMKLLAGNAEQEQNLLRLGVNKLGDTDKSIASKASHHLLVLLQAHPAMKAVVVREVSTIVLRPVPKASVNSKDVKGKGKAAEVHDHGLEHGRYYGLITLNQITLTSRDRDLAGQLVHVYFELFREILNSGNNKAPHDLEAEEQAKMEKVTGKVDKWQGRRKGTKQSRKKNAPTEDEVEQGDSKLIAAVLTGVSRALPFARLDDDNFQQHVDTLFKITHTGTFNISIRALMLIHQVSSAKQETSDRFYRTLYESLLDPRLLTSSKQAMYLNLLFKAVKADTNLNRVMAFVKRLVQVMMGHQPPFICGALYLLGELFSTTTGLSTLVTEPEDSGIEHFVDVPEGQNKAKPADLPTGIDRKPEHEYDGRKRDPQHSNAKGSCLWELIPLTHHYHPSVAVQATELLALRLPLSGSSDISQNTLVSFLDRFVYRNPKKNATAKGASIMQPAAAALNGRAGAAVVVRSKGARIAGDAAGYVNDEKFWNKKIEDVPADQLFFHKYFSKKLAREDQIKAASAKRKKKSLEGSDVEEEDDVTMDDVADDEEEESAPEPRSRAAADKDEESDAEEDEIWKAMQASMPQAGYDDDDLLEDSDEDEDLDISDEEDSAGQDVDVSDDEDEDDEEDGRIDDAEFQDEDEDELPVDEDEDDLVDLDDLPNIPLGSGDFGTYDSDDEEEIFTGVGKNASKKRKRDSKSTDGKKKEKRKKLPLLASAEDYAALINDAEEENI